MWRLEKWATVAAFAIVPFLGACSNHEMHEQERYDPLEQSLVFPDSQSARGFAKGTVSRGEVSYTEWKWPREPRPFPLAPQVDSVTIPMSLTMELLARGRERYLIYCAPCHGAYGQGDGMITRHGFPNPPSYHLPRLLEAPDSHYYGVITHGFGRMYPYAYRVKPADRWAVIAYIRALQLSRNAKLTDVPPAERRRLESP